MEGICRTQSALSGSRSGESGSRRRAISARSRAFVANAVLTEPCFFDDWSRQRNVAVSERRNRQKYGRDRPKCLHKEDHFTRQLDDRWIRGMRDAIKHDRFRCRTGFSPWLLEFGLCGPAVKGNSGWASGSTASRFTSLNGHQFDFFLDGAGAGVDRVRPMRNQDAYPRSMNRDGRRGRQRKQKMKVSHFSFSKPDSHSGVHHGEEFLHVIRKRSSFADSSSPFATSLPVHATTQTSGLLSASRSASALTSGDHNMRGLIQSAS